MHRLLIFFSILQLALCVCPSGFELVRDGQCRGLAATVNVALEQAVSTAIAKCNELGAQPIIIHNSQDDAYWQIRAMSKESILGVVCNSKTKKWEWSDGSVIDYNPASDTVLKGNCDSGCVFYQISNFWTKACGRGAKEFAIHCTKQLPSQPVSDGDVCSGFVDNPNNGVCYQVFTDLQNWGDAYSKCYQLGAQIASIHSHEDNEFVRRLAVSKGAVNGVYLGGRAYEYTPPVQYLWGGDGSDFDYTYWQPGLPVDSLGYCITMDTLGSAGRWVNTNCDSKMAYVCNKKRASTTRICPSGPWKEGEIITSPGFPFDSSTACDYILTVASGKKVQVEVMILEANSCCDRLVILDNIVGGNIVANLTGEVSFKTYTTQWSNIMRVSWVPNGGVNVRGLQMTFKAV